MNCARSLSSPAPRETQRRTTDRGTVYAGWLFVEASHTKREFKWRYCVLDDVLFQVYTEEVTIQDRQTPHTKGLLVREHLLTHVERMHRLNRGMLLVDITGYGLWVHGTHDEQYFMHWFAAIQAAVLRQPIRVTISTYGFVHQSSDWARQDVESFEVTGWLHVRRTLLRGWLVGPSQRLYCVLSGRRFSAFKLNLEGRWADLYGKLKCVTRAKDTKWLKATLDNGTTLHMKGTADDVTDEWSRRMDTAIRQDPMPASERGAHRPKTLPSAPRRILTC